jgi:hypothetical protein
MSKYLFIELEYTHPCSCLKTSVKKVKKAKTPNQEKYITEFVRVIG